MQIIALSRSKFISKGNIDCDCRNPKCKYYGRIHFYVDGGSATLPAGSVVQLRCSECGFRWEHTWYTNRDDPNPELVRTFELPNSLFYISEEDCRKLSDVLIEIFEKIKWN